MASLAEQKRTGGLVSEGGAEELHSCFLMGTGGGTEVGNGNEGYSTEGEEEEAVGEGEGSGKGSCEDKICKALTMEEASLGG
jgi:hypothetical protein